MAFSVIAQGRGHRGLTVCVAICGFLLMKVPARAVPGDSVGRLQAAEAYLIEQANQYHDPQLAAASLSFEEVYASILLSTGFPELDRAASGR